MTPLDQRMRDLNAALALHDLLVESPNPGYPCLHLYLKAPISVSKLLMSLLLKEQGKITLQDAATLDHIAKTFLRICALNASADDTLPGHGKPDISRQRLSPNRIAPPTG